MNVARSSSKFAGGQILSLIGWLAFCLAASGTAAFVSTSGWYAELNKPTWNPPGWIFGPVWTSLYVMMAVSGSQVHSKRRFRICLASWSQF